MFLEQDTPLLHFSKKRYLNTDFYSSRTPELNGGIEDETVHLLQAASNDAFQLLSFIIIFRVEAVATACYSSEQINHQYHSHGEDGDTSFKLHRKHFKEQATSSHLGCICYKLEMGKILDKMTKNTSSVRHTKSMVTESTNHLSRMIYKAKVVMEEQEDEIRQSTENGIFLNASLKAGYYVAQPEGLLIKIIQESLPSEESLYLFNIMLQEPGMKISNFLMSKGFTKEPDHAVWHDTRKKHFWREQFLGDKLELDSKKHELHCNVFSRGSSTWRYQQVACSSNVIDTASRLWLQLQTNTGVPCDSQSAIAILCNLVQHSRTKHNPTQYTFHKGTLKMV
ncbi:hypothetical protein Tco_0190745 [Tanacetum coccineum]